MAADIIILLAKIVLALIGGLVPVLIWLWFWKHEDKHPEPPRLLLYAFLAGMAAVIGVIPFEDAASHLSHSAVVVLLVWAAIEELAKFGAAAISTLSRAENDEPIDSLMYMIAAALGFAALENVLFIITPILEGRTAEALVTGNIRFLGATLIHTVCSSIIGYALALSFYKDKTTKRLYIAIGLVIAIVLHTMFNLSIMLDTGSLGVYSLYAVWISLIVILLLFEKVKGIKKSA